MPPLKAVMVVRKPKALGEGASAAAHAVPRIQNPAASKMLSLVDSLEEELFAAEARRHDAEVGLQWILRVTLPEQVVSAISAVTGLLDVQSATDRRGFCAMCCCVEAHGRPDGLYN